MSVGYPVDRSTVDSSVGTLARQMETFAARAPEFKAWLDTIPDVDLQAPPYNYTAGEVALLKSAVNDMQTLVEVYLGNVDHTPASAMNVFIKQVAGIPAVFV